MDGAGPFSRSRLAGQQRVSGFRNARGGLKQCSRCLQGKCPGSQPKRGFRLSSDERDLYAFDYYGHHQFLQIKDGRLHMGIPPSEPINDFRCGEKVVIAKHHWRDVDCSVRVRVLEGGRDAGLLFSCTLPGLGYDAQNGYFAGIIPGTGKVVLGSTNGHAWREIALVDADIKPDRITS
jgi:hypothetical protein